MEVKEYDMVFSLGFSCGTSQALRAAGLQFASYPLDWTGSPGILTSANIVANDFAGWLEAGDLELVDVRHGAGFCTRCYRNRRTGFGFSHEFSDMMPLEESLPMVRGTYVRRIKRFIGQAGEARRMLAVYMELPIRQRAPEDDMVSARRIISERFPQADVDLLYVGVEPGCKNPELREVAPGVFEAGFDYRKYDRGEVTHFIGWEALVPLLRANFRATDPRSDAARHERAALERKMGDLRWGLYQGRFRRWLNKHAYKTYRSLERLLVERNLVQREGPLWFVEK